MNTVSSDAESAYSGQPSRHYKHLSECSAIPERIGWFIGYLLAVVLISVLLAAVCRKVLP